VSAGFTSVAFAGGGGAVGRIVDANDGDLASLGGSPPSWAVDSPPLPSNGSYAVLVEPASAATGTLTVTLSDEVTGTIAVNGTAVAVTISRPGQRARVTFSGTSGGRLDLGLTGTTFSGTVSMYNPNGSTLLSPVGFSTAETAVEPPALAATGTYQILIDPGSTSTGSTTLTLSDEVVGTIVPGGSAVTVTISRAGQRARISFSGTASQRVSIGMSGTTIGSGTLSILRANETSLKLVGIPTTFVEPTTLPATESYALLIDPSAAYTGATTATMYDVPPDVTGTLTINGATMLVTITAPGQNGSLTFSGTASQAITIRGTGNTLGCVSVSLSTPGAAWGWQPCTATFNLGATLSSTGTYTIKIDPTGTTTGSVTIGVTSP
jgi:hypothetical protein